MGMIQVKIVDVTGNKEQQATLPDDAPINRILAKVVQLMALPTVGPDKVPLNYKFYHKASSKQLSDWQTLRVAGVKDNDVLRLQPEITAGKLGSTRC